MRNTAAGLVFVLLSVSLAPALCAQGKSWQGKARIAAEELWTDMSDRELREVIDALAAQNVSVVDIDLSTDPIDDQVDLIERILAYAREAHPRMAFFVYQAPLERVSEDVDRNHDGVVDGGAASYFSLHPEWAQRGLGGEPAVLYGAAAEAFWVGDADEDLWLCPNDPDYQKVWKDEISRIAATGVHGIYIDVPFLRGWFDEKRDWRWACACSDCAALFKQQYGSEIPKKADWEDADFRRFVRFRFEQIENFIAEVRKTVRAANGKARLIVEQWDGLTDAAETGCDPALVALQSDARCHEWTNIDGSASDYQNYSWMEDMVRYLYYRAVDGKGASWVLAYSHRGHVDAMQALAALQLTAGCNFWETDEPDMTGSVDEDARTDLFAWIADNEKLYYHKKAELYADVGLYYSRDGIVFHDFRRKEEPWLCAQEFLGLGMLLLQRHIPFRVVLPGSDLRGIEVLVLPAAACLSDVEAAAIIAFAEAGGAVLATGPTGRYDEDGVQRQRPALAVLFQEPPTPAAGIAVEVQETIGYDYYQATAPNEDRVDSEVRADQIRERFDRDVWPALGYSPLLQTDADLTTILVPYRIKSEYQVRAFRVGGIGNRGIRETTVSLRLPEGLEGASASFLKFLSSDDPLGAQLSEGYTSARIPLAVHGVLRLSTGN